MIALLLDAIVKSSLLIGAAAVIDVCLRRRGSAATRHLVWTLAIAGLLVLPAMLIALPRWELNVPVASAITPFSAPPQASPGDVVVDAVQPAAALPDSTPSQPAQTSARATGGSISVLLTLALVAVYALVAGLLLLRLALQHRAMRRLALASTELRDADWTRLLDECARRLEIPHAVRLLRSCQEIVPMAFGLRVPTILVPAMADTWADDRRRAVLFHELAHIVRRDCTTQTAAAIACALYWFHPGVWWAARRLRAEREIACDDRVISAGTPATDYADHLLELAYACVGYCTPAMAVSMARPSEVEGRLRALLDTARNRRTPAFRTRLASASVAMVVLAVVAAARAAIVPVSAQTSPTRSNTSPASEPRRIDAGAQAIAEGKPGTWEMRSVENGIVHVRISESQGSWHGFDTDTKHVEAAGALAAVGNGVWRATLKKDAGTFSIEGILRPGVAGSIVGAGTFTFSPSETFPSELEKRGFARPTRLDQYLLARSDVGFAFIDELAAQRYAQPDLALLVRAAEHGLTLTHVREMGRLGYHVGQVEALITQVDHGVSPAYVRELQALRFARLSADDLVRTRDHGVDATYLRELKALGYNLQSVDAAVRARDHGVDPVYVRGMREAGYQQQTIDDLVNTRDHGVDLTYVKQLQGLGYARLSLDELIRTRDHGVDAQYVQGLVDLGYKGLLLEQLIRLRDHGVDPAYIRELKTLGIKNPTPDELVRLRDSGFTRNRLKVELAYQFERVRLHVQRVLASLMN